MVLDDGVHLRKYDFSFSATFDYRAHTIKLSSNLKAVASAKVCLGLWPRSINTLVAF